MFPPALKRVDAYRRVLRVKQTVNRDVALATEGYPPLCAITSGIY